MLDSSKTTDTKQSEAWQPGRPPPRIPAPSLGDVGSSAAEAEDAPHNQPAPPAKPVTEIDLLDARGGAAAEIDDEIGLDASTIEKPQKEDFFNEKEEAKATSEVQFSAYYPHQAQANRRHGLYIY